MTYNEFIPFAVWAAGICGCLLFSSAIAYIWLEWVYDNEMRKDHPLKKMWNSECSDHRLSYVPIGFIMSLFFFAVVFILACAGYWAVVFYPVTLSVLLLALLSFLARMAVRHRKMFDEHVEDKDAHSGKTD